MGNRIKLVGASIFVFFVFVFGASADTLGQNQRFFISLQYDAQSRAAVNATLRYVSERAYFYVTDDYWDSASAVARSQAIDQIKLLAQEFDARTYPIETQFFGAEPNPGIDGDSRITILLAPLIQNAGGYFDTTNQYPSAEVSNSNQREMIYLNVNELASTNKMFAFLAHEFQHLISFNQKENLRRVSDDIWLNELRSEYAVTLLGYNNVFEGSHLQRRVRAFLSDSYDSLTEWKNLPVDYGQIGLFGEYIAEHYSPQVIADTLKNNLAGISSINESLARNNFSENFDDIYRNWLIAGFLNNTAANSKFGYTRNELRNQNIIPTKVFNNLGENTTYAIADSIKDWQGRWYDISQLAAGQKNVLKIVFNSQSLASFDISYIIFKSDGSFFTNVFNPLPGSNIFYVPDMGSEASRIIFMPIKRDKLSGFSANEIPIPLTISMERVETLPENAVLPSPLPSPTLAPIVAASDSGSQLYPEPYTLNPSLPDGSLIRARGDFKVYVVKGNWRRHIVSPKIFGFYPGLLGFDKVQEIEPSVLAQYQESNLIRYADSKRVYAVNENGARQWLNMSGGQFSASGRSWDAIFTINSRELNYYPLGQPIPK